MLLFICVIALTLNAVSAFNETDCDSNALSINENIEPQIEVSDDCAVESNDDAYNLTSEGGNTFEITQITYENYFNPRDGKILPESGIASGDTIKIGNVSNRAFVIDRPLTVMPITSCDKITNGYIHLIEGSDGSTITNLTINNTKGTLTFRGATVGQLHGIWLTKSNNNLISYNTIRIANAGGVYAMPMGWSSNNRIIYNDMKTYITSNIIMGQCHHNLISHNSLEVLSYSDMSVTNLIYFNPFNHADYSGSPLCVGNVISYNYLKGYCTLPMSIILQMTYANHEGTVVANNTIFKGSYGINLNGDNVSVYGNVVDNSATGISVAGNNFTVYNNTVSGSNQKAGIHAANNYNSTSLVYNNNVTFVDVVSAMSIKGNVDAYDNVINVKNYGTGISVSEDGVKVHDNRIRTNHDDGISVLGSNNEVDNNIITTNAIGVSIPAKGNNIRYYNNTISRNIITSDSYGVYIDGLVYNTVIVDNVIETNGSVGIYKDITDELSTCEEDNMVNGVIMKSTAAVINDTNYYDFFDREGNLVYDFPQGKTKVLILTFLTNKNIVLNEKINLISNKLSNLLFNVTITFKNNSSGSLIRDFNFINSNRKAIVLDNVKDISITKNNINAEFKRGSFDDCAILFKNSCENSILSNNNIFISSKRDNVYAIKTNDNRPCHGFLFEDNTIIMISSSDCSAVCADSLSDSKLKSNNINIISEGSSSGFNLSNSLDGIELSGNEIIIHADKDAYPIRLSGANNSTIEGNTLYAQAGDAYAIHGVNLADVSINENEISTFGHGGNSISASNCSNLTISNNLIHTNTSNPILFNENVKSNSFVIDDANYDVYFDKNGNLRSDLIGEKAALILNLTDNQMLKINTAVDVSSFGDVSISARITFDANASNSRIYGIKFANSTITSNASDIQIYENAFSNSTLTFCGGEKNVFKDNNLSDESRIIIRDANSIQISNNTFNVTSADLRVISILNAQNTLIKGNIINASSNSLAVIYSSNSTCDDIEANAINAFGDSSYAYMALNSSSGEFTDNEVYVYGDGIKQAGVLLINSSNNEISKNRIISHSKNPQEYAVEVISDRNLDNRVVKNYLISANGLRYADEAVNAEFDVVDLNAPRDVFVSADGSDVTGDGSESNPYQTIAKAIENALNHSIIYVSCGNYSESNISIDKNLTLISLGGKSTIECGGNQLFKISEHSSFTISGFVIRNAHNVEGGSVFINNGRLLVNNSCIFNSSSYFDNSNPVFDRDLTYDDGGLKTAYTVDCRRTGMGGVILNRGELVINSTVFANNLGHWGGVIADFGKTSIESSLFDANRGVHGGAIFSNTTVPMNVRDCIFNNNVALTSIDYCAIRLYTTSWSIDEGNHHQRQSACELASGVGGAIYANNDMIIENSQFISNSARTGGAIASYNLPSLELKNSTFLNNRANDTRYSNGSNDLNNFHFSTGYHGGAILGNYNKLHILDSEFYFNQAIQDGGAIQARAKDGKILDSIFTDNTAGLSGGALDISDNFLIMRSVISNNSASYGGAIEYDSSVYYGHIQNNFNIYNSTISGNRALTKGGAFSFGSGNVSIRDSNIVDNFAPASSTVYTSTSSNAFDMRYNYWGRTPSGFAGPDDSVWAASNNQFKPWYSQWVRWNTPVSNGDDSSKDDDGNNDNPIIVPDPKDDAKHTGSSNTGSSASTGTRIGGGGDWPSYNGDGDGTNPGYNGIGNNHNGMFSSLGGRGYSGQNINGVANTDSNSKHNSNAHGNVNTDSLSKSNSSTYNPDFASIGMTANSAASASSAKSGSQSEGGSSSSDGESVSKSYEINELEEIVKDENTMIRFLIIAVITLLLLIVGYRRKEKEEEY